MSGKDDHEAVTVATVNPKIKPLSIIFSPLDLKAAPLFFTAALFMKIGRLRGSYYFQSPW